MSRYYDPVTHRFVNADGYFQSGGDVLDSNMSAYCRNNPISYVDPTGTKCSTHDPYYVPNCFFCNPDYLEYERNHIDRYNRINGTNYTGINDKGQYITAKPSGGNGKTGAGHAVSTMSGGLGTAAGAASGASAKTFGKALGDALGTSGILSIVSIVVDSFLYVTDPFLTDNQKLILMGIDVGFAVLGLITGAAITLGTKGTGVHAGVCASLGINMVGITLTTYLSNSWSDENARKWCPQEFN